MKTVLFVGAGRHQRRAIVQARERGLRVVAVDRNPDAPGLQVADVGEVVDFTDVDAVDGGRAPSSGRRRADRLGRPRRPRRRRGHRAPRTAVDRHRGGAPHDAQDRDAPVARRGGRAAAAVRGGAVAGGGPRGAALGRPCPPCSSRSTRAGSAASSGSRRRTTSRRTPARRAGGVAAGEAILEGFVEGTEMNGIVIARDGTAAVLTLSDRLRPPGIGFGVGWIHVYPASAFADQLALAERVAARAVEALGLRDGIAFPQLIAHPDGSVAVVEVAARIPGGQMADLVRHARASTSSRSRCASRSASRCRTRSRCRASRSRSRSASSRPQPGPLPDRPRHPGRQSRRRCSRRRASSRPTRTCRSARRSGPCGSTATVAAT